MTALKEHFNNQGVKVESVEITVQSHGFESQQNLEGNNSEQAGQEKKTHRKLDLSSLEELEEAIGQVPLDIVQIHGTFDEALIPKISVPVIRAIQISDSDSQVKSQADYLLFDAPIAGSGQTFDWQLLADKQIEQDYLSLVA